MWVIIDSSLTFFSPSQAMCYVILNSPQSEKLSFQSLVVGRAIHSQRNEEKKVSKVVNWGHYSASFRTSNIVMTTNDMMTTFTVPFTMWWQIINATNCEIMWILNFFAVKGSLLKLSRYVLFCGWVQMRELSLCEE